MTPLYKLAGFIPYILIVALNAMTDLGHKIILQNTVFKAYDGTELMVYTAIINSLILLPFIFLFSPSGYLSDRYPKTRVIQVASFVAIIITSFITYSYYQGWFEAGFILTLLLAAQSALYSPAKYGLIKEMFGTKYITSANGTVQAVTIAAILLGGVVYSIFFEQLLADQSIDRDAILTFIAPLGFVLIASSILEFLLSLTLPLTKEENTKLSFSMTSYMKLEYFFKNRVMIRRDGSIWYAIIGLSVFWGVSQIVVAVFGAFLKSSLGVTDTVTAQAMLSLGGLGIILGSIIASRVSKAYIETGLIPLGSVGVAVSLGFIPYLHDVTSIGIVFFTYGVFGGLFIVPLNALIQFSAPSFRLGKVLAANNFYQNVVMFVFLILTAYISYLGIKSEYIFSIASFIALLGALFTIYKLPQSLVRYVVKSLVSFGYKTDIHGLENIPNDKGVLLLGNHISYLDWAILQIAYPKQIRFVMERAIYEKWYFKWFLDFFNVIPISKGGSKGALSAVSDALKNGDTVALFPEGYLSRNGQINPFLRGFEIAISGAPKAVIVPFFLRGLWETRFSHSSEKLQKDKTTSIIVSFGEALSAETKADVLREKVIDLSMFAWEKEIQRQEGIASSWIERIVKDKYFFVADSMGLKLHGKKFLAGTLMMRTWLKPQTREQNIGLILPSSVAGAMANMALLTLGKTLLNLNYTTGIKPLEEAMKKADIHTLITSRKFIDKLAKRGFDLGAVFENTQLIYLEEMKPYAHKVRAFGYYLRTLIYPTWLLKALFSTKADINDAAVILFSSGSEGSPKGIVLSHKNILGNTQQVKAMLNPEYDDVLIGTLPIFHSFGLTVCTLLPQLQSIPVIYHPDPTDGYAIGKLTATHQGTILLGTATFLRLYARNRKLNPLMFKSVRKVIAGAEKVPQEIRVSFKEKFGLDILEGYGATETSPVASANIPDVLIPGYWRVQAGNKIGTIGKALAGSKIIITDPVSFEELPVGEEGMMLIGGVQVMKGYLKDESKTNEVIKVINGHRWYVTGDKGKIDEEGFVTIVDRYSRFAKIGGEMVSLGAVEEQIRLYIDADVDICAVSLPDAKKGEKVVLLYTGDIDASTFKQSLIDAKMNPLYIPSVLFNIEELPKLGTGKADFKGSKTYAEELDANS